MTALAFDHDRNDARTRLAPRYDQLFARASATTTRPRLRSSSARTPRSTASASSCTAVRGRTTRSRTSPTPSGKRGGGSTRRGTTPPRFRITYEDADGEVIEAELFHSVTTALDAYTDNLVAPPRGVARIALWEVGHGGRWTVMESDHLDDARARVA
jgi:hypothetical protein